MAKVKAGIKKWKFHCKRNVHLKKSGSWHINAKKTRWNPVNSKKKNSGAKERPGKKPAHTFFCRNFPAKKVFNRKSVLTFWIFSNGCFRQPEQTTTRRTGRFFAGVLSQQIPNNPSPPPLRLRLEKIGVVTLYPKKTRPYSFIGISVLHRRFPCRLYDSLRARHPSGQMITLVLRRWHWSGDCPKTWSGPG